MAVSSSTGQGTLPRRHLLRLAAADAAAWIMSGLQAGGRAPARAQGPFLDRSGVAETPAWLAYARWLNASWTTMAYPERYDCDLPIWYMAMWAKENGVRLDWSWPDYFRQPVVLKFTGEASRDLPLQSWRSATCEEFARVSGPSVAVPCPVRDTRLDGCADVAPGDAQEPESVLTILRG